MKTFGRTTILANYTENDILSSIGEVGSPNRWEKLDKILVDIISGSMSFHLQNKSETQYLLGYLYGDQDIKKKVKKTRENINNKTTENWVWAFTEFKKAYLLGKPIQYVQLDNSSESEISKLNKFVRYENKKAKDMEIYGDVLATGRGFRYTNKDAKSGNYDDEAPFEIINCPVTDTEVIYSSKLGNEQLLACIYTPMVETTYMNVNGEIIPYDNKYNEVTAYLRNWVIVYSDKSGKFERTGEPQPLMWNEHIITEYYINKKRISLTEIGKDLFDDINYLESLDKDDMEQFVNAILVFTNATVSEEDLEDIKELGALSINSTEQKKASVDLLQGRLNATDTQTYYNRLLSALHQILAVPMANENGTLTYGDTGQAKLTGMGYTEAGIRTESDETMFGMCDYKSLKVIIKICKSVANSGISSLNVSDIDSKFQRDMSDNLLVKTQALSTLYNCDIPRKFANSLVNLFGDPQAVTQEQEELFGEQQSQLNQKIKNTTSTENEVKEQNNNMTRIQQIDLQNK